MSELGDSAREAIAGYRNDIQVPAGRAEANWAGLESRLAQAGASTEAASTPAATGSSKGAIAAAAGIVAVVIVAVVVGGRGGEPEPPPQAAPIVTTEHESPPISTSTATTPSPAKAPSFDAAQPEPVPDPSPTVDAVEPAEGPASDDSTEPGESAKKTKPRKSKKPPLVDTDLLAKEAELIARIKSAMVAGKHTRALELIRQHRKEFATGVMTEDRHAFEAVSLCALGKHEKGQAVGRKFLAAFPSSTHAPRVRAECGLD